MLETLAEVAYRYNKEAKIYVILTGALFAFSVGYGNFVEWSDSEGLASILLFLGVFGNPIMFGFCLCVFYMCFLYAFHPELNGKAEGNVTRCNVIRVLCAAVAVANCFLLFRLFHTHIF